MASNDPRLAMDEMAGAAAEGVAGGAGGRDAGRAAVIETIEWIDGASVGEICVVGGFHRVEAREMKALAKGLLNIMAIARQRGEKKR